MSTYTRLMQSVVAFALASAASAADCQRVKLLNHAATGDDHFGRSVAIDADVLLIGAPSTDTYGTNVGIVFVSTRTGGVWGPLQELTHGDPNLGVVTGRSVALDRDRLALSLAHSYAEVWEQDASAAWAPVALFSNDDACCTFYGESIALHRNVLAVGAPYDSSGFFEGGSVYIYERDPNGNWSQRAEVWPDDVFRADRFGLSLAVDRRRIVAGAPEDDDLGFASGSAYVFEDDPNAGWVQAAKLLPSDGGSMDVFGAAVAIQDGTILVGAQNDNAPATSSGSVYVFEEVAPSLWWQRQKLTASDAAAGDKFGWSVDLDGAIAVIGARTANVGAPDTGAAYVFHRQPSGLWLEVAKLVPSDRQPFDEFGNAVAVSGTTAIIGAWKMTKARWIPGRRTSSASARTPTATA